MNTHSVKPSILIVEDDAEFAVSLQKILQKADYEASVTSDGTKALRLLNTYSFSLVITDFRMEPISGLDLTASIRRQNLPARILLLTAYGDESLAAAALAAGADAYLEKPVRREEILSSIAHLLGEGCEPFIRSP